jgi:inhibitor of cysteine peptidase
MWLKRKGLAKTAWFAGAALFLLLHGAAVARAQGQAVSVDGSRVGGSISLRVGDTLEIKLKADAGGAYVWRVAENDPALLQPLGRVTAPGYQTLRFRAVGAGGGRLSLLYQDLTKPGVRALDTYQAVVVVDQGPQGKKVVVRDADSGSQVTIDLGDTLVVRLTTDAGAGFSWAVAQNNPFVLRPVSSHRAPPANGTPSGGSTEQGFHFKAVGLGGETLILTYRRPMGGGSSTFGASMFVLNVLVLPNGAATLPGNVGAVTLWDNDNGRRVPVRVGATITVRLNSNPTTGYSWNLPDGGAPSILQLLGTPRVERPAGQPLGAPGTQVYRFKVVSAGQGTLRLLYQRPWEKGIQAARKWEAALVATP